MTNRKYKLTPEQKAEKKRRRREYVTIFVGGKQKRVKRPQMIEGLPVDEFIKRNADPIFLHQNERHEELHQLEQDEINSQPLGPPYDPPRRGSKVTLDVGQKKDEEQ